MRGRRKRAPCCQGAADRPAPPPDFRLRRRRGHRVPRSHGPPERNVNLKRLTHRWHPSSHEQRWRRPPAPKCATCPENRTQSDRDRTQIGHPRRMESKTPATPRIRRYINLLTIDPSLHRHQWIRWRVALVLRLQVAVGGKASVTRMLEVLARRSDGLRARSRMMESLEERLKSRSLRCSRFECRKIFSFSLACRARDLASWGGLLACWRQLETARPGEDLTLRRCCRNRASVVAKSWHGRLECLGDGAQ